MKACNAITQDGLNSGDPSTAKAYQVRLNLQEIYHLNSLECFGRKLIEWCDWVQSYGKSKGYLFKSMIVAANSILNHFEGVVSFSSSRITYAFMEGLNSVQSESINKAHIRACFSRKIEGPIVNQMLS